MNAGPYVLIQYYNNMYSHYDYNVLTRSNVVLLSMKYFREPCCLTYYIGLQDLASCNKVFDSRALFTCLWPSLNWGTVLISLCLQLDHYIHICYDKYTIIHNKDLLMNLDKIAIQKRVHQNAQVWRNFRLNSWNPKRLNYWSYTEFWSWSENYSEVAPA